MAYSQNHSFPTVTLSVRVQLEARDQLAELAEVTGRTKSFLAAEAIEQYLATHSWQIKMTEESIKKANSKRACFVNHSKVSDWLNSWGSDDELDPLV